MLAKYKIVEREHESSGANYHLYIRKWLFWYTYLTSFYDLQDARNYIKFQKSKG